MLYRQRQCMLLVALILFYFISTDDIFKVWWGFNNQIKTGLLLHYLVICRYGRYGLTLTFHKVV